jgi:hypothetical protein
VHIYVGVLLYNKTPTVESRPCRCCIVSNGCTVRLWLCVTVVVMMKNL